MRKHLWAINVVLTILILVMFSSLQLVDGRIINLSPQITKRTKKISKTTKASETPKLSTEKENLWRHTKRIVKQPNDLEELNQCLLKSLVFLKKNEAALQLGKYWLFGWPQIKLTKKTNRSPENTFCKNYQPSTEIEKMELQDLENLLKNDQEGLQFQRNILNSLLLFHISEKMLNKDAIVYIAFIIELNQYTNVLEGRIDLDYHEQQLLVVDLINESSKRESELGYQFYLSQIIQCFKLNKQRVNIPDMLEKLMIQRIKGKIDGNQVDIQSHPKQHSSSTLGFTASTKFIPTIDEDEEEYEYDKESLKEAMDDIIGERQLTKFQKNQIKKQIQRVFQISDFVSPVLVSESKEQCPSCLDALTNAAVVESFKIKQLQRSHSSHSDPQHWLDENEMEDEEENDHFDGHNDGSNNSNSDSASTTGGQYNSQNSGSSFTDPTGQNHGIGGTPGRQHNQHAHHNNNDNNNYFGNNYSQLEQILQQRARLDDLEAQQLLAQHYYFGNPQENIQQNLPRALEYFAMAAENGDTNSLLNLGSMHANGSGTPQNGTLAKEYFLLAIENGNHLGYNGLGFLYSNGIGVIQNKTLALEYFSLAAESGDVESIFNYAMMVYDGTDEVSGNSTLATLELLSIKTQSKSAQIFLAQEMISGMDIGIACEEMLNLLMKDIDKDKNNKDYYSTQIELSLQKGDTDTALIYSLFASFLGIHSANQQAVKLWKEIENLEEFSPQIPGNQARMQCSMGDSKLCALIFQLKSSILFSNATFVNLGHLIYEGSSSFNRSAEFAYLIYNASTYIPESLHSIGYLYQKGEYFEKNLTRAMEINKRILHKAIKGEYNKDAMYPAFFRQIYLTILYYLGF